MEKGKGVDMLIDFLAQMAILVMLIMIFIRLGKTL